MKEEILNLVLKTVKDPEKLLSFRRYCDNNYYATYSIDNMTNIELDICTRRVIVYIKKADKSEATISWDFADSEISNTTKRSIVQCILLGTPILFDKIVHNG